MWSAGKRSATLSFFKGRPDLRFSPAGHWRFLLGGNRPPFLKVAAHREPVSNLKKFTLGQNQTSSAQDGKSATHPEAEVGTGS